MQENQGTPPKWLQDILCGMAYGLTAGAVSHPFDTMKCRLQTGVPLFASKFKLLIDLRSLYQGVGMATAASICFRSVPFIGYETISGEFRRRQWLENAPLTVAFISGAIGGVMRGILETPAEYVKTRQQLSRSWKAAEVFRGLGSTCIRNAAVIGTFWVIFVASLEIRATLPPMAADFFAGGVCSVGAWALIFPLDTVKSQIQGNSGTTSKFAEQLLVSYRNVGICGLYSGMGAGLTRVFLANGCGMIAYGLAKNHFISPQGKQGDDLSKSMS